MSAPERQERFRELLVNIITEQVCDSGILPIMPPQPIAEYHMV